MSRQRVLNILRGPEAGRIRFTCPSGGNNITIAQATFLRVARAIDQSDVRVTVTTTLPAGVAGRYTQPNNLEIKPIIGRGEEGDVLHECTHGFFDLTKTAISALDEEAAAYVVSSLYFRMTGLSRPRWAAPPHLQAGLVADALLREYAAGTSAIPTVNSIAWNLLRLTILAHPSYEGAPVTTGGSYPHNG